MFRPRTLSILALGFFLLTPPAASGQSTNVAVVVEHDLYASGAIGAGLTQYLADITAQGYSPIVVTGFTSTSSPAGLRQLLTTCYNTRGLAGAVLIGHLPVQNVYTAEGGGIAGESHPSDLYYTDLDGSWTVSGAHGALPDDHTDEDGDVGPKSGSAA
ncbi:MAG TPA: hypothetical protein VM431_16120 [Phycisphaerae bacterium]|nr:hypothetical protein [Phycisphaerae bacterium]